VGLVTFSQGDNSVSTEEDTLISLSHVTVIGSRGQNFFPVIISQCNTECYHSMDKIAPVIDYCI